MAQIDLTDIYAGAAKSSVPKRVWMGGKLACAIKDAMSNASLLESLKSFVAYTTEPGEKSHLELLERCDRIIAAYHESSEAFDDTEYPDPADEDHVELRERVTGLFPDFGLYNLPATALSPPGKSEIIVGDSVDDICDLVGDFREYIWRFSNTSEVDAVWYFRQGYFLHWGTHMRELQFYLWRREISTCNIR